MYTVFSSLVTLSALMMTANAVPTSAPSPNINMAPLAPFAPVTGNNDISPQCAATLMALEACLTTTNSDCVDAIDTCMSGVGTNDSTICSSIVQICHAFSCCVPCAVIGRQFVECESHARGCDIQCPVETPIGKSGKNGSDKSPKKKGKKDDTTKSNGKSGQTMSKKSPKKTDKKSKKNDPKGTKLDKANKDKKDAKTSVKSKNSTVDKNLNKTNSTENGKGSNSTSAPTNKGMGMKSTEGMMGKN